MSRRFTPREGDTNGTRVPDSTPLSIDTPCPDDEAYIEARWREAMDAGQPVSRRFIRQQLRASQARWDRAEADRLGSAPRYLRSRRSVAADPAVGEYVANRLTA